MTDERSFGAVSDFGDCYYQKLKDDDIIDIAQPLLTNAGYKIRSVDGKLETSEVSIAWATPWHHIHHDHFLDCGIWHQVMFNILSKTSKQRWVPIGCQHCWKVVVRPKTLRQLFALAEIEKDLMMPSKCGIETREYVHGLYGGYFYNHSLEEGLACYEKVRDAVDNHPELGKDIPIILKRACTEYEHQVGPSDKWQVTAEQARIETLVNKYFVRDNTMRVQPEHVVVNVHRRWIEWAYANGDSTYSAYTNGQPLYHPYVTYHHLVNSSEEEKQEAINHFHRKYYFGYDM